MRVLTATFNDFAGEFSSDQASAFGFPALNNTEIPICGIPGVNRICTRAGMRRPSNNKRD